MHTMKPCLIQIGQTVKCVWPALRRWYVAIITDSHDDGTYSVKYLVDFKCRENVNVKDIKPLPKQRTRFRWLPHVDKLRGKTFFDEGSRKSIDGEEDFEKGEFTIMERIPDSVNYHCKRVFDNSEGVSGEIVEFDMYYLMKRVRQYGQE